MSVEVMQNLYPLFERNRILKKEMLWSLRDYTFAHARVKYQEYGQGILTGCSLSVKGEEIAVRPGLLKYGPAVCILMEEARIPFEAAQETRYLQMAVREDRSAPDYTAYRMELALSEKERKEEGVFELCRFHLRKGAALRTEYKSFADMETEYDTVDVTHADWGGLGGKSLAPEVTRRFAEEILSNRGSREEDRAFAMHCLCEEGAMPVKALAAYAAGRMGGELDEYMDMQKVYGALRRILEQSGRGEERPGGRREKRKILVD